MNQLCQTFTKQERSLIFSSIKKSSFLKSMIIINFPIRWSTKIFNLFNISMMLNKLIIRWFSIDVTAKSQLSVYGWQFLDAKFYDHHCVCLHFQQFLQLELDTFWFVLLLLLICSSLGIQSEPTVCLKNNWKVIFF